MSTHDSVCFLLSFEDTPDVLCTRLSEYVDCVIEPSVSTSYCYLDSFDWRLHQSGLMLLQLDTHVELQEKKSGQVLHTAAINKTPVWATDLPAGGARDQLSKILEMRALMPVVCVDTRSTTLAIRDEDGKTVVRLRIDNNKCHAPNVRGHSILSPHATLLPLKGYAKEMLELEKILLEEFDLTKAPVASQYAEALAAIGRKPGDYTSKLSFRLKPGMTTGHAMHMILLHLLNTIKANIEGTREDIDSEFLHDLRVATRRTRSALTQVKKVLPPKVLEDYKNRFAWVGQITGPTRDMDVFQLDYDNFRASLPPQMRGHLEPLHEFIEEHHHSEQKLLKRRLNSAQFRKLIEEWEDYLKTEPETGEEMPNSSRAVLDVSRERIWKMYRLVLKEGRAITYDSPPEDMHELRKSCKKLRYLMEFFSSLYPAAKIESQIKVLKVLLNNLGDFQDYEVQAAKLMSVGEQMKKEGKAPTQTVMAMGVLVANLLSRQEQAHKDFSSCFAGFDTPQNHSLNRELFKPATNPEKEEKA